MSFVENRLVVTRPRLAAFAVLTAVAAVTLAACGSSSSGATGGNGGSTSPTAAAPSGAAGANGAAGGNGVGRGPAASGEIAQITGATLQVQSTSTQTAVTYSGTTRFTIEKATTLSAIKVGSCITATSTATSGTSTSTSTPLKATTVRVSAATNGKCTVGFGGGGGFGGGNFPGGVRPSGGNFPSGAPGGGNFPSGGAFPSGARPSGGGFRGAGGFGNFATGKVTAISGSTITVQETSRVRSGSSSSTATPTTTSRTITVTSATKYTTNVATTKSSVKVGLCATVQGKTDSKGAVAATSIALSNKTNGTCTTGFARGGTRGGTTNG